ncbi:MAG TPA: caspase family protein [Amycolatopsis sp.]|nr:caspase family protein [Amycolatopsis sp.]
MAPDEPTRRFLIATAVAHHAKAPHWDRPGLVAARARIVELFTGTLGYTHVDALGMDPTREELTGRLRAFCRAPDRRPDDVLAVYVAAHGEVLEGSEDHVVLTADTDPDDVADALPTVELARKMLLDTPVRRLLLMLDTCYSGHGGSELTAAALTRLTRHWPGEDGSGLVVVTSAQPAEQASVGAFPQLLGDAVANVATAGHAPATLSLDTVVKAMNANPARPGFQTIGSAMAGLTGEVPPFLPNPRHGTRSAEVDLAIQHAVEWDAEARRRDTEFHATLLTRAKGGDDWWFSGRVTALRDITRWLSDPNPDLPLLAVTAAPGSGKTAVLGLVAALSHPDRRRLVPVDALGLPSDAVPASGSVDVAVYAQNLTTDEVLRGIAAGVHVSAETPGALLDALTTPVTVLVDALDEAADPHDLVLRLLRPLAEHAAQRLRLLVGTRPHLLADLGLQREDSVDLDASRYADLGALTAYAARCLRESAPGSPFQDRPAETAAVAAAVAAAATPSFLVARITGGTLAAGTAIPDWHDPAWRASLPRLPGAAMRQDLVARLGVDADRVRDLLRPLAFAEGQGLPWEDIWAPLATRLSGVPYTDEDLLWLRRHAGSYVVETVEAGRSAYRVHHQALTEYLREDVNATEAHEAFTEVLLSRVPLDHTGRQLWTRAHPYVLRHLATHAARCGQLDELVTDPGFLTHAGPDELLPALDHATASEARLVRSVYRSSAGFHRRLPPQRRRIVLATDAARFAAGELHRKLVPSLPWFPHWATGQQISPALRATFVGGEKPVTTSACTVLDGRPIAVTAGHDAVVRVWDLETGTIRATLTEHTDTVDAIACTVVDRRTLVVTAGRDAQLLVWDPLTGATRSTPTGHGRHLNAVTCTELDGRPIAVVGGPALEVWDLRTGTRVREVSISVTTLASTLLDGRPIAVTAHNSDVYLVDLATGDQRRIRGSSVPGDRYQAVTCTIIDGRPVALGGSTNGQVEVWDLTTGAGVLTLVGHRSTVTAVSCTTIDGEAVAVTGGIDGTVRVWDLAGNGGLRAVLPGHGHFVSSVTCTVRNGRPVAVSTGLDGSVRVWDITAHAQMTPVGHTSNIAAIAVTESNGVAVAVTAGHDRDVRVWEFGLGRFQNLMGDSIFRGHTKEIYAVACTFVAGRPVAITGGADEAVKVWDVVNGTPVSVLEGHRGPVRTIACSTMDGRPLAVSAGSYHDSLFVWWLDTGEVFREIATRHAIGVNGVACATVDHRPLAVTVGYDGTVHVWDLLTGIRRATLTGHEGVVQAVACTEIDGHPVAVTGGTSVRVWDLTTGVARNVITGHKQRITAIACHPYDAVPTAVVIDSGGSVRLWDLATGTQRDEFDVAGTQWGALAIGPGGEIIVGSGWDLIVFKRNNPRPSGPEVI